MLGIFGTIFGQFGLNIGTVFGHSWLNFRDYVQTVQIEISGLFSGSFGLSSSLVLIPRLMSSGFFGVFWYPNNSVTNRERPRGALFYVGPRLCPSCVL